MELLDSSCNVTSPWLPVPVAKLWLYYTLTLTCAYCAIKKLPRLGSSFVTSLRLWPSLREAVQVQP